MENTNTETQKKDFNIVFGVIKVLMIGAALMAVLYTTKAMVTDTVLENLEKNYSSAINSHDKSLTALTSALESEKASADTACSAYKSLKAYKESKNIKLSGTNNPCMIVKAPQEGF